MRIFRGRRRSKALCLGLSWVVCLGSASDVAARSLSEQIGTLLGPNGIVLDVNPSDPALAHTAHFTSSTLSTLGLLVEQLAPTAADFPAISSVPGFTYRYNPELDEFERASTSLGPIFVERARTIGKGKFDIGAAYSYVEFSKLNGNELDDITLILTHGPSAVFGAETATVNFEKFDLRSHVLSLFATYGITDRWDVNLLLPVVHTSMDVRARAQLDNVVGPFHFFDQASGITAKTFSAKDDKTGVGDLLLRTKYHLLSRERFDLTPGLVLRVPTGDEENFQGLGNTTLNFFLAASGEVGRLHVHTSIGFDVNLNEPDRSRVRYAGGVTVQLVESFALTADVIGNSNLKTYEVSVTVPEFDNNSFNTTPPTPSGFSQVSQDLRTNIVDLALGFKVQLHKSVIGFANVFIPLNDEGLRAKAVPTVGLEVSF